MDISPIRVVEKLGQGAKPDKIDPRSRRDAPTRADHPVEHPRWDLKPTVRRLSGKAAAENRRVTLLDHFMNMDLPPGPGMPRIKKLALNTDPVGVPSSSCIMAAGRILALTTPHPIKPTSTRCPSAWRHNPGGRSTYRRGKSVQTTGTSSDHARLTILSLVRRLHTLVVCP
jgi:hypothetical protein